MKISINKKIISRNKKLSQITLYISLGLLILGFIWTIRNSDPSDTTIGYLILIPAYLLVQISIYLANRWGKSPRPDEIVHQSLKGLDDKYSLYSFTTGVPYLLIGPMGIWIINPYYQKGTIYFDSKKNQYKQEDGPRLIGKYFGQEGIPNISLEIKRLERQLEKYFDDNSIVSEIKPIVINLFYSDEVSINKENAPDICLKASKIKDFLRKSVKKNKVSDDEISDLRARLPDASK